MSESDQKRPDSTQRASIVTGSRTTLDIEQSVLRMVSQPVPEKYFGTETLRTLVEEMWAALLSTGGYGIAAPQVGISWRLFIGSSPDLKGTVFINPTVTPTNPAEDRVMGEEGCLSIPGWRSNSVPRHREVAVEYFDMHGRLRKQTYEGFAARIIQHEFDHLNGVLFIDLDERPYRDDPLRRRARKEIQEMENRSA